MFDVNGQLVAKIIRTSCVSVKLLTVSLYGQMRATSRSKATSWCGLLDGSLAFYKLRALSLQIKSFRHVQLACTNRIAKNQHSSHQQQFKALGLGALKPQ